MKKTGIGKRLGAFIMAVALVLTMDSTILSNLTGILAYAADDSEDLVVSSDIIDEQTTETNSGTIKSDLTIPYGDEYKLRVTSAKAGDRVSLYYYDADLYNQLEAEAPGKGNEAFMGVVANDINHIYFDEENVVTTGLKPGSYYLAFIREDDEGGTQSGFDNQFGIVISNHTLNPATDIQWNTADDKYVATWTAPTQSTDGKALVTGTDLNYKVKLLKDGSLVDKAGNNVPEGTAEVEGTNVFTATTGTSYDFTTIINSLITNKKYGHYTFTVQAIAGSDTTKRDTYGNLSSECYENAAVTSFEEGVADVEIRNTTAPVVDSYKVNDNDDGFTAVATDDDDALTQYVFTTALDASEIADTDWVDVTDAEKIVDPDTGDVTFDLNYIPTTNGNYYLYVKDNFDNVGRSSDYISVTKLIYHNVYETTEASDVTQLILGNKTKTNLEDVTRNMYNFQGWYTAEFYNDDPSLVDTDNSVSTVKYGAEAVPLNNHKITIVWGDSLDLYASWQPQTLKFESIFTDDTSWDGSSEEFNAIDKYYDGDSETITATLAYMYNNVTYTWYKKVQDDDDIVVPSTKVTNTKTTLELKNVPDSGTYYVKAESTDVDGNPIELTSPLIDVTVNKRTLALRLDNKTITYGDAAPDVSTYTYQAKDEDNTGEHAGLVPGETLDDKSTIAGYTEGTITCPYNPLDPDYRNATSTGYDIAGSGFDADNYEISVIGGNLIVNKKNVNDLLAGMRVQFHIDDEYQDTYSTAYTGEGITPAIAVWDDNNAAKGAEESYLVPYNGVGESGNEYDITYTANVNAGTASVALDFTDSENYTGSLATTFTIEKAPIDVNVTITKDGRENPREWTYGEAASIVGIDSNPGNAEVVHYYMDTLTGNVSTTVPVNAGTYVAYAVLSETDNYQGFTTSTESSDINTFTINPYVITFTANSGVFEYDGNEHTVPGYTQEGEFQYTDSLKYASVTGSQTDIGEGEDNVTVEVSDSTIRANYAIVCVPGTITVTAKSLKNPSTFNWDNNLGELSWIAVTRKNVDVGYRLRLYRVTDDGEGGKTYTQVDLDGDPTTVGDDDYVLTTNTEYSFNDVIHADAEAYYASAAFQGSADKTNVGYTATIQTVSVGGIAKDNYSPSEESDKISTKYTTKVELSIDTATVDGANFDGKDYAILLQGETKLLTLDRKTGYEYPDPQLDNDYLDWNYSGMTGKREITFLANCANPDKAGVQLITLSADDERPYFLSVNACNLTDYSGFGYSFQATDELGVTAYAIDTSSYVTADTNWQTIMWLPGDTEVIDGQITSPETTTYYVHIKDTYGNTNTEKLTTVYSISFDNGRQETEQESMYHGSMSTIYRVEGSEAQLTLNQFTKDGFSFKNWEGTYTIHDDESGTDVTKKILIGDGGKFSTNSNLSLVAKWTAQEFSYQVQYYEMDVDGNYSDTPTSTANFKSSYNKIINYDKTDIQAMQTGFYLDTTKYGTEAGQLPTSYTITDNTTIIKLYYARNVHTLTYILTPVTGDKIKTVESYRYGQTLGAEQAKTQVPGYEFVGWQYSLGNRPTVMPDSDITAEAHYNANATDYVVVYHMQNLDGRGVATTYTIDSNQQETIQAFHDSKASFAVSNSAADAAKSADPSISDVTVAKDISGFTPYKVVLSNTSSSDADISHIATTTDPITTTTNTQADAVTGTVNQDNKLYINIYYNRNSYDVKLNVWYDGRDDKSKSGKPLYTSEGDADVDWNFYYGYAFTAADINDITNHEDINDYNAETNLPEFWGEKFTALGISGYSLANYVDWSTGNQPSTMPAGDVTVTREFAQKTTSNYTIHVYLQGIETVNGKNVLKETADGTPIYEDIPSADIDLKSAVGTQFKIGEYTDGEITSMTSSRPKVEGHSNPDATSGTEVYIEDNNGIIQMSDQYDDLQYYDFDRATATEGVIPATGNAEINIYFTRKEYTTRVYYYSTDDAGTVRINYRDVKQAWETSYDIDPAYYFGDATKPDETMHGATKNYAAEGYFMYYGGRYSIKKDTKYAWPSYRFKTDQEVENIYNPEDNYRYTLMSTMNSTDKNSLNYMSVYYQKVNRDNHYQVEIEARRSDKSPYTYIPMTYELDGKLYEIRVANKADIFQSYLEPDTTEWEHYPAGGLLAASYAYRTDASSKELIRTEATATGDVSEGQKDITGTPMYTELQIAYDEAGHKQTYYKYDADEDESGKRYAPDGSEIDSSVVGVLYRIDPTNQFYAGFTCSYEYKINENIGYDSVKECYKDKEGIAGRIRVNSSSYRPTVTTGKIPNFHYFYYWENATNLSVSYKVDTSGEGSAFSPPVSYGGKSTGNTYTVSCPTLEGKAPAGYTIAWYDSKGEEVTGQTKTMGATSVEYVGKYIANPVNNHAYISYELPAAIKSNISTGDNYTDYVDASNVDTICPDGETTVVWNEIALDASVVLDKTVDAYNHLTDEQKHSNDYIKVTGLVKQNYSYKYGQTDKTVSIVKEAPFVAYYIGENLVYIDQTVFAPAGGTAELPFADYNIEGVTYDDTNSNNKLKVYVPSNATGDEHSIQLLATYSFIIYIGTKHIYIYFIGILYLYFTSFIYHSIGMLCFYMYTYLRHRKNTNWVLLS